MKRLLIFLSFVINTSCIFAQNTIDTNTIREITLNHIIANDSIDKILPFIHDLKKKRIKSKRRVYYWFTTKQSNAESFDIPKVTKYIRFADNFNFKKSNLILRDIINEKKELNYKCVRIGVFIPTITQENIYVVTNLKHESFTWLMLFKYDLKLNLLSISYFSLIT